MKVVQINSVCGRGSTGKICVAISQLLTEAGVENYILYSRWSSDFPLSFKYENDRYARVQAFREKVFGTFGFEAKSATNRLINKLEEIKPDIVHLHILHSHDCNLTLLFDYLRKSQVKVFWTFHDCWAITGYCPHFEMIGCEEWKHTCNRCPVWKHYSWFFDKSEQLHTRKKKMIQGVDLTIVAPSRWVDNIVKQSFMDSCPVKIINNGVDVEVFKPYSHFEKELERFRLKYGLGGKRVLLGVADVWSKHKGLDDYIKLASVLPDSFIIVMVGLTEKQIKCMPNNILGLPRTSTQQELVEWYSLADVVLNLSYEETFGMTTVEGFACGTPCVAYNKTASSEFSDDKTCIVVEAGNTQQTLTAINSLLEKDTVNTRRLCRNRAIKEYDMKTVFREYIDLYSESLKGEYK